MSIFEVRDLIIEEYGKYIQSFLHISDDRVREFVESEILAQGALWPEALLQLNPAYEMALTVEELANEGKLHPLLSEIFLSPNGQSIRLYSHQYNAIKTALKREHFVVTSGTGSGKSLTYFIPIFNAVLREEPQQLRVRAIVVYPMNALVNSQFEALTFLAEDYKKRTGKELPVRFAKYTGQESEDKKRDIQQNPPHILLTNYVMLELMLVRPEEHHFIDRTTAGIEFLVVDELHTYRGRQGADVAFLIRRLRERCGNPELLCIGTSATMVAGDVTSPEQRRQTVAEFASKFFGVPVHKDNVIEESLQRLTRASDIPDADELREALISPVPETLEVMQNNPLATWIELTFGLVKEPDGNYRRATPLSLSDGARKLADSTGVAVETCEERLQEMFLVGSRLRLPDGNPFFAFKLHQFITQGRTVYTTIESANSRFLSLEGQYYAPGDEGERVLFPLVFCRLCGQDYYRVYKDNQSKQFLPNDPQNEILTSEELEAGYVIVFSEDSDPQWSKEYLPPEWIDKRGNIKRDYRPHIPQLLWVSPDGSYSEEPKEDAIMAWFQPMPFMICLNCGEFYTRRDKNDFRKLASLSSEGRSTATTVLSVSTLRHAPAGGIDEKARKILSFTDNRQDAALQAGHFNDFVQVSLLRSAIYAALTERPRLRFDEVAKSTVARMGLSLKDIAEKRELRPDTPMAREVWNVFHDLIEYRIFEDLRRGWRVVQPNLEQCGLLRIEYMGLEELCNDSEAWEAFPTLSELRADERKAVLTVLLDHFRKKLAIHAKCLQEPFLQQLQRRAQQHLNEKWAFEESERLYVSARFLLPGHTGRYRTDLSLAGTSLLGRYFKRELDLSEPYEEFIQNLINILCSYGLLRKDTDREVQFVQLDASALLWCRGEGYSPGPDPIYSRRAPGQIYKEVDHRANEFFRDFYRNAALSLKSSEGREHTAQIKYEEREARERRFREGELSCLFCSPTMELGIDIADLQLVHLRNVPPTPANYAQRSGRSGRKGDPALVLTYCASRSGHDQYFFHHRADMVAGSVRAPRIDLSNEDLVKAHVHAVWLGRIQPHLGKSMKDILEVDLENYPLKENLRSQIKLPDSAVKESIQEIKSILQSCEPELLDAGWYSEEWLESVLRRAPEAFDEAFNRWRELFQSAMNQLKEAQEIFYRSLDKMEQEEARRKINEANRQRNLLLNLDTTREESDFYPYRYLASEGFLPGYNFPRLPVRAFIPRGEGEFISRPRFLGITEFGPRNIIYHEGARYDVRRLISTPGGLQTRRSQAKICQNCGYFQSDVTVDLCENCKSRLDASNSEVIPLLEMPNVKTIRRERITCDEEERLRSGYDVSTHFRFAPAPGGEKRALVGVIHDEADTQLFRIIYAPTARLYRINHGSRRSKETGFLIDLATGEWLSRQAIENNNQHPESTNHPDVVRLYVQDTSNMLLLYSIQENIGWNEDVQATLQYALHRGIEEVFQIEESEIASQRIGSGEHRAIMLWEAAEGGVGVLRRLVDEPDAMSRVAQAALERCHFDIKDLRDARPDCAYACYECLLSYSNQRDYPLLNRHLIKDILERLSRSTTHLRKGGRDYEEHYRWLRSLTDTRSDLERRFVDLLYKTKRRLPDEAQKPLKDYYSIPDFFYEPNTCVFCDGSVHDDPDQKEKDRITRQELKDLGYRVIVIRYDQDLEDQIQQYPDIFGKGRE